ncbi:uncharacterized protein LOC111244358 [Varroa destructor]|uniref:Uncharacterized protein n=1 Tax=Varroa destructor TaxID=109461 RepID=A0A7M7J5D5_VARDE|nr:uncharacterized protein LOC111244358 [Varroa destructor]
MKSKRDRSLRDSKPSSLNRKIPNEKSSFRGSGRKSRKRRLRPGLSSTKPRDRDPASQAKSTKPNPESQTQSTKRISGSWPSSRETQKPILEDQKPNLKASVLTVESDDQCPKPLGKDGKTAQTPPYAPNTKTTFTSLTPQPWDVPFKPTNAIRKPTNANLKPSAKVDKPIAPAAKPSRIDSKVTHTSAKPWGAKSSRNSRKPKAKNLKPPLISKLIRKCRKQPGVSAKILASRTAQSPRIRRYFKQPVETISEGTEKIDLKRNENRPKDKHLPTKNDFTDSANPKIKNTKSKYAEFFLWQLLRGGDADEPHRKMWPRLLIVAFCSLGVVALIVSIILAVQNRKTVGAVRKTDELADWGDLQNSLGNWCPEYETRDAGFATKLVSQDFSMLQNYLNTRVLSIHSIAHFELNVSEVQSISRGVPFLAFIIPVKKAVMAFVLDFSSRTVKRLALSPNSMNFVHKIVRRLPHQSYGKLFMDSEEKHSIGVRFDLSYAEDRLQFWLCHIIVERSTRYDCVIKEDFQVPLRPIRTVMHPIVYISSAMVTYDSSRHAPSISLDVNIPRNVSYICELREQQLNGLPVQKCRRSDGEMYSCRDGEMRQKA